MLCEDGCGQPGNCQCAKQSLMDNILDAKRLRDTANRLLQTARELEETDPTRCKDTIEVEHTLFTCKGEARHKGLHASGGFTHSNKVHISWQ